MKLATFDWQDGRHVGRVDSEAGTVARFDLSRGHIGTQGVASLIGSDLPPVAETLPLEAVG